MEVNSVVFRGVMMCARYCQDWVVMQCDPLFRLRAVVMSLQQDTMVTVTAVIMLVMCLTRKPGVAAKHPNKDSHFSSCFGFPRKL